MEQNDQTPIPTGIDQVDIQLGADELQPEPVPTPVVNMDAQEAAIPTTEAALPTVDTTAEVEPNVQDPDPATKTVEVSESTENGGGTEEDPGLDEEAASGFEWEPPTAINNVEMEHPYATKVNPESLDEYYVSIPLPADTSARVNNYIGSRFAAASPENPLSEDEGEWLNKALSGIKSAPMHDCTVPAMKREGSVWKQSIKAGDKVLSIAAPRLGDDGGPKLTGKRAVYRVRAELGMGSVVQVPLYHSGFWVTLRAPSETELIKTNAAIHSRKIAMGAATHGLAFANHAVYTYESILDLAMECVYETTLAGIQSQADIRALIQTPDINILAWGLACAIYPRGFNFERSLIDPDGVKTVVVNMLLNVGKALVVDDSMLNEWQKTHMAKRGTSSMGVDQVKMYRDHFVKGKNQAVNLSDRLTVNLRTPSVEEFIEAGNAWVNELIAGVKSAFTEETDLKRRNELVLTHAKATTMRQYTHWVESFEFPHRSGNIDSPETIASVCADISANDKIRAKFYEAVSKFINDSLVAVVAIPQVHPSEEAPLPRFETYMPIDPISVFSNLLSQKIQIIQMRP